ncbi:PilN domain-containing protein [Chloroflexota bacterium]
MAKKIVTLYIDDTSLRLMVTQGQQIKEWAESPLEPGLVENNVVIGEAEVATKIKQLFEKQKVKTKKIIVGLSGLHCFTRPITLPPLPKEMIDEAVRREAQRVLPVPLEEFYVSWQIIPAPEKELQVFLVAIPCKAADALLKVLRQVGLKASLMDIKPLLLAGVVKRETKAVIVDVQATGFDIVVMADGIPQPVRSIRFADEALSDEAKLTVIKEELNRTITFYNSNNSEKALDFSVPIFVSGRLADESELCQTLSDEVGHPVLPLPSPMECPEGLDPSHYMTNIGLAFQELSSGKEAGASVISLNALPAPYQPKPVSLINVLAWPGAVVAVGLLVFLVVLAQNASADIASMSIELSNTNQLLQQRQSQQQELAGNVGELQKKVGEIEASRDSFIAALGILEEQSAGVKRDLEATIESLPASISLSSIGHITSILTITGRAPNEEQILSYIRKLDSSGRFGDITITGMTRIEGEGIDFTLLGTIQTQRIGVSSMEIALGSLPTAVSLTGVNFAEGTLTIDGTAPDEDKVFSYLRALEASGKFSEITITSMMRTEAGGMDFSLVLKTRE